MSWKNTTQILILAGGKGKRMQTDIPKALVNAGNKTLIDHILGNLKSSEIAQKPIVVTGAGADLVRQHLGENTLYAHQEEQLGSGHAVSVALPALNANIKQVLVLNGDHPLVTAKTVDRLAELTNRSDSPLSLATAVVSKYELENHFNNFGRIIRNTEGDIIKIVEAKDATDNELSICEVNPAYMCFKRNWLEGKISNLNNNNAQGEYYITDLIHMAFSEHGAVPSINIESDEVHGINTPDQLKTVEDILKSRTALKNRKKEKIA